MITGDPRISPSNDIDVKALTNNDNIFKEDKDGTITDISGQNIKEAIEKEGKVVTGYSVPSAPCVAAKVKLELAKHRKAIESSDAILVLACGLGIQSVKENMRIQKPIHVHPTGNR